MRLHLNSRLAKMLFFVLFVLCMHTVAEKDTQMNHKETVENMQRIVAESSRILETNETEDVKQSQNQTYNKTIEKENSTEALKAKDNGFWKGFVNSLSMIFFVEFGDRVYYILY